MKLAGKVAIVTGASRGLGQAMAIELARAGAAVAVAARHMAHRVRHGSPEGALSWGLLCEMGRLAFATG